MERKWLVVDLSTGWQKLVRASSELDALRLAAASCPTPADAELFAWVLERDADQEEVG